MLYFVPKRKSVSAGQLRELGLAYAIDSPVTRETMRGPGNQAGILVADSSLVDPARLRYAKDEQEWRKLPGAGEDGPSVGRYGTERHPTPDQLARPRQLPGPEIELLDGQRWTVPLIRTWQLHDTDPRILYHDAVPRVLDIDDSGKFVTGAFVPQFAALAARGIAAAESIYNQLTGRDSTGAALEPQEVLGLAVDLLGTNYRVGRAEIALMRILDEELANAIVRLSLDLTALVDHLKNAASRRASGGTTSPSGAEPRTKASRATTGQPSAS